MVHFLDEFPRDRDLRPRYQRNRVFITGAMALYERFWLKTRFLRKSASLRNRVSRTRLFFVIFAGADSC